jgi:protein-S-isoprenylcysteine O-methyltransferase Ste14
MDWTKFQNSKLYDLLMAVPLILWFGNGAIQLRPRLVLEAGMILGGQATLFIGLQFFALTCAALFNLLLVWLLLVRNRPVHKSKGLVPRLCGFAGTFLGVGILHLPVADLSLPSQMIAALLVGLGSLGSALVLAQLGKSFSIMPEARRLVTNGPYAYARHPLYAVEMLTLLGTAIQFAQPWAALLALGVLALQVTRALFEEQVLAEAYPEYDAYRRRTRRFIPGVI